MTTSSVIIMDSHPIVRKSLEILLKEKSNIDVVLKTDESRLAMDYLRNKTVNMVIMDIELPGTDGFILLKKIKKIQKETKVLFLSSKPGDFYARRAIEDGASGFISKDKQEKDIMGAVNAILSGYSFFSSRLTETLMLAARKKTEYSEHQEIPLSNKEIMVMRLLLKGFSNIKIGEQLMLSNKTISTHKSNIFHKLNIKTMFELMDFAKTNKLI